MAVTDARGESRMCSRVPMRHLMAIMGSIGLAIIDGFKVNVSVAIVAMVNHTAVRLASQNDSHVEIKNATDDVCYLNNPSENATVQQDGPFVWNEPLQGLILSSYFWGYMISLLPGGRVAELFSAKWMMIASVFLNVVASLLSPLAAEIDYKLFIFMRVLQGMGGGVTFPSMHVMLAKWAPPLERSVLASIVYAGTALGPVIFILLTGHLATNWGWASVFYVEGALCLIWCIAWSILVADSPEEQKRCITEEERNYIMTSLGQIKNQGHRSKAPVPWKHLLQSAPFYAILVAHFCGNFGWYMLLTELPTFMNQILKFDLSSNAVLTALPFFCMWLFTMLLSKVLQSMQVKTWISVTVARKIGTFISSFVPSCCLLGVSYVGCNRVLAVFLMTIGITCINHIAILANHIDVAPNFAGTMVAITNTFATIPGLIVPIFVGKVTHGNQTIEGWRVIFFTTVSLYVVELFVYTMFGTGVEQPWNKIKTREEKAGDKEQHVPLEASGRK